MERNIIFTRVILYKFLFSSISYLFDSWIFPISKSNSFTVRIQRLKFLKNR